MLAPPGVQNTRKMHVCVFSSRRGVSPKGPWRCRGVTFFEKARPQFWVLKQFRIVEHSVWCTSVFCLNLFRAFNKRPGALFRSFGSRGPLLRPRRKNTAYRRDWRSVGDPFWPEWAWHSRVVHIFKKLVFCVFCEIHAVCRVSRSLGGSWASPGTLWGGPGGPTTRPRSRPL